MSFKMNYPPTTVGRIRRTFITLLLAVALLPATGSIYSAGVVHAHTEQDEQTEKPPAYHYVCPMHEDVTSKKPGKCRKCKMKLEKKRIRTPAAEPADQ